MKSYNHSSEIFADGLAVGVYDIRENVCTYATKDRFYTVPVSHPSEQIEYNGVQVRATTIESLLKADNEKRITSRVR